MLPRAVLRCTTLRWVNSCRLASRTGNPHRRRRFALCWDTRESRCFYAISSDERNEARISRDDRIIRQSVRLRDGYSFALTLHLLLLLSRESSPRGLL